MKIKAGLKGKIWYINKLLSFDDSWSLQDHKMQET